MVFKEILYNDRYPIIINPLTYTTYRPQIPLLTDSKLDMMFNLTSGRCRGSINYNKQRYVVYNNKGIATSMTQVLITTFLSKVTLQMFTSIAVATSTCIVS